MVESTGSHELMRCWRQWVYDVALIHTGCLQALQQPGGKGDKRQKVNSTSLRVLTGRKVNPRGIKVTDQKVKGKCTACQFIASQLQIQPSRPLCENNPGPSKYFSFAGWHQVKFCQERRGLERHWGRKRQAEAGYCSTRQPLPLPWTVCSRVSPRRHLPVDTLSLPACSRGQISLQQDTTATFLPPGEPHPGPLQGSPSLSPGQGPSFLDAPLKVVP